MQENKHSTKVVTRFAPSPTGFMHVGGVRTALYAWLWARKNNGTFILRIEDTDKEREVSGSIDHIKQSLSWLGIEWDHGPDKEGPHGSYVQSERLHIYRRYADILISKGYAYADPYSEEHIESLRAKAEEEKRPFLFRDHRPQHTTEWDGSTPLRFKIPELKRFEWHDEVWGDLSAGEDALDDFILMKSDGYPTYNFAHIVDDIEMGVTHVMRGQEFISSMPKFLSLYSALDIPTPYFVTLPPIMAPDGKKKLGKRDGAKDILEYKKEGYLPDAMINFLALLGWNPGDDREIFSVSDLIDAFDIAKIQHSGAQLSDDKLDWVNKEHLKLLSEDVRMRIINEWFLNNPLTRHYDKIHDDIFFKKITPIIFDRISKWGDIDNLIAEGELSYFFEKPTYDPTLLAWKDAPLDDAKRHLLILKGIVGAAPDESFNHSDTIKSLIFDYATQEGRGNVLWPLRVALSGKEKSPDPFTLAYVLGKEETVGRIEDALEKIK